MLPPFLSLRVTESTKSFYDTVFDHKAPVGPIRTLWWPPISQAAVPSTILLFIPGNPGILEFYIPFLDALHVKDKNSTLAIMAHSHIGQSPGIDDVHGEPVICYTLSAQVQSVLEAYDTIRHHYGQRTKVALVGHSVGAWLALQVVKARPYEVEDIVLLFPTITQISKTPNGKALARFFAPIPRYMVSILSYCSRLVPDSVLSMFYLSWPLRQVQALRSLLNSPQTIRAAMAMAHSEMQEIKDLDTSFIIHNRHRLCLYFAERDGWVGEYQEVIKRSLEPYNHSIKIDRDIPHSFCINHGEQVAQQCHEWLR